MSNQIPRPSYLATKYGHPTGGEHDKLYESQWLKSGLTPLNFGPFFTNRYDLDNLRRWEAYQQDRFDGQGKLPSIFIFFYKFFRGSEYSLYIFIYIG